MRAHEIENVGLSRVLSETNNMESILLRIYHLEQTVSDLTFELNQAQKQIQRIQ